MDGAQLKDRPVRNAELFSDRIKRLGSGRAIDRCGIQMADYRAELPAGKAGCLSKGNWVRDES